MRKRIFAAFVCLCMMMALVPSMAYAGDMVYTGGLCEHHTQHDDACGYSEGTAEVPCSHEHTEDCYQLVTNCVYEHTAECYSGETTEPICGHMCSEESGCITKELNCNHEHDASCGYVPATEGTPCNFVCEICNAQDSEEPECNCDTKCTEEEVNADCPVCGGKNGDISSCVGKEKAEEPQCVCDTKCTEEEPNADCPVCGGENGDITDCVGAAIMLAPMGARTITPEEPEGKGISTDPYQITNAAELYWFAGLVNGTLNGVQQNTAAWAVLTTDITINDNVLNADGSSFEKWTPIGNGTNPYTGTFDGDGHTISGLYLDIVDNASDYLYAGLFGYNTGTIQNVTIDDSYISATVQIDNYGGCLYTGGICGYSDGAIINCHNGGTVTAEADEEVNVGGICGKSDGTITGCTNQENIAGKCTYIGGTYAGGICGKSSELITGCTNQGDINVDWTEYDAYVGGICAESTGTITSCTNQGAVTGKGDYGATCGGICGQNKETITDCGSQGNIYGECNTGNVKAGGICGRNYGSNTIIENCSNQGNVTTVGEQWAFGGGISGKNEGMIKNCNSQGNITLSEVDDTAHAGGISGTNDGIISTIINCSSVGTVTAKCDERTTLGGISGTNEGTIKNCTSQEIVTSQGEEDAYVGGICGRNGGTITNCISQGDAMTETCEEAYVGGISGDSNGTITKCSSQGTVMAQGSIEAYAGGICGYNTAPWDDETVTPIITSCISNGNITASGTGECYCGGVSGYNHKNGIIQDCYYLKIDEIDGIGKNDGSETQGIEPKQAESFSSGEVVWLLNHGQEPHQWVQKLGSEEMPRPIMSEDDAQYDVVQVKAEFPNETKETEIYYANVDCSLLNYPGKEDGTYYLFFQEPSFTTLLDIHTEVYHQDRTIYAKRGIAVTKIVLNSGNESLYIGETMKLLANVEPPEASSQILNWSSSDSAVAEVDQEGNVKALKPGIAIITVEAADGQGAKATCQVEVKQQVTGITLNKTALSLYVGKEENLTATIAPGTANDQTLEWSSNNEEVATVDENGKVTALKAGKATITATAKDGQGAAAQCQVEVKQQVTDITLNKSELSLYIGREEKLTATVNPDTANDLTLTWSSNNPEVATVDQNGNVKAISRGEAVITATAADGQGAKAECKVTVRKKSSGGSVFFWDLKFDTNGGSKIDTVTEWEYSTIDLDEYIPEKEGYKFVGWYADKDLDKKIDEVYLTEDTTVYAKWEKIAEEVPEEPAETEETEPISFLDVKESDWFYEAVSYAVENGLMSGMSEDIFAPNTPLTREMLAVVLYNVEGQPESTEANTFTDVKGDMWYTDAILWANANGIVAGYDNGAYGVGDLITREQFATILYRYAQFKGYDTTQGGMAVREFSDYENISDYARPAMAWAVNTGIMGGMDDGTLMPQGKATRAEAATMLMNFCENVMK